MVKIISNFISPKEVIIPGSKSEIIRYLLIATFSKTKITLHNVNYCDDVNNTLDVISHLGAIIQKNDATIQITGFINKDVSSLNINESATLLRLLIPYLIGKIKQIKVAGSLINRNIDFYEKLYQKKHISIHKNNGLITILNNQTNINFDNEILDSIDSSQYLSGLLISQTILYPDTTLIINKPIVSFGYLNLTINILKEFGYNIDIIEGNDHLYIKINKRKKISHLEKVANVDYSNSAYLISLGLLHNDIIIKNYINNTYQPDYDFIKIIESLNGNYNYKNNDLIIYRSYLDGNCIDLTNNPDLGPILMVLGCFTNNKLTLINTNRLKLKESNRLLSLKEELAKLGVIVDDSIDNQIIIDNTHFTCQSVLFNSHNDHRIAMSLIVLATMIDKPCYIDDIKCINKSYPNFIDTMKELNIKFVEE